MIGRDSIHYSSRASIHDTSVRARLSRGPPSKLGFGLLGWLVRFARDDPELAEGESRTAKSCRKSASKNLSLRRRPGAPDTRAPGLPGFGKLGWRCALRVAGWRSARRCSQHARFWLAGTQCSGPRRKNFGGQSIYIPPFAAQRNGAPVCVVRDQQRRDG
jgi:hypothetical protein